MPFCQLGVSAWQRRLNGVGFVYLLFETENVDYEH